MIDDIYVRKDVYQAEQDNIITAINDTNNRIDDLKDNINRTLALWGIGIGIIAFLFAAMQIGIAIILFIMSKPG